MSVLKDGKLKPGIYKIQNIVGQTFVDIRERTKELCGRPATVLGEKGLWEILPSGPGYTIRRLDPGKPEQFCTVLGGSRDKHGRVSVSVAAFPATWRVEVVRDQRYKGREYVRFFWGTTNLTWDLSDYGSKNDHTPVHYKDNQDFQPCRIWKLIPVKPDAKSQLQVQKGTSVSTSGSRMVVSEVTTTTATVTTRKEYQVEWK